MANGKKYRLAGVKEAPVFYPTPEQFEDPLRYIASIREEAEPFGICKIVPPAGFKVPFVLDTKAFTFSTRVQVKEDFLARCLRAKTHTHRWISLPRAQKILPSSTFFRFPASSSVLSLNDLGFTSFEAFSAYALTPECISTPSSL